MLPFSTPLFFPLITDLTANSKKFDFAYDDTTQKYGYTIDNEFRPFSSGAILLGEYSANTTIDVSALGVTSADQFLLVPSQSKQYGQSYSSGGPHPYYYGSFALGNLSLNDNVLTVTLPSISGGQSGWVTSGGTVPSKVYYVGDIESAS